MGVLDAYRQYRKRKIRPTLAMLLGVVSLYFIFIGVRSMIPEQKFDLLELVEMKRNRFENGDMPVLYRSDTVNLIVQFKGSDDSELPCRIHGTASEKTVRAICDEIESRCQYYGSPESDGYYLYLDSGILVFRKTGFYYYRIVERLKSFP